MSLDQMRVLTAAGVYDPQPGSAVFPPAGGVYPILQVWIRREKVVTPTPPPGTPPEYEWSLAKSLAAPPDPVPNVTITGPGAISIGPTETGNVTVGWDTATAGWESYFSVRVRWFVNGSFSEAQTALQSAGAMTHPFYGGTDVYAEVRYFNEAGDGPVTTTGTVHIGI